MAIIIRPNGGINNAMAGLAAGFGQGMQLGIAGEKLRIEQEKLNFAMSEAERKAALELAAEERAKAAEGRAETLFNVGMDERAADKAARGYLADAQDARMTMDSGALAPLKLPEQFRQGPQQSNMDTGQPIQQGWQGNFDRLMAGLSGEAYAGVRKQYDTSMRMASNLASRMSPEMARMYMQERERQGLLAADDNARKSFGSLVSDQRGRGAFRVLLPDGTEAEDPQVQATLEMLLEQAENPNIPLQTTQQQVNTLLSQVGTNNLKARDFQFQTGRINNAIMQAQQTGNGAAVSALQALQNNYRLNPFASQQTMSEDFEKANQGLVRATIGDKTTWVNALTAKEDIPKLQAEYEEAKQLRIENENYRNQLLKAQIKTQEAQAEYLGRRETGLTEYQAQSVAASQWRALGEEGQGAILDSGVTAQDWISQRAAELRSGGATYATPQDALGGSAARNAPQTPTQVPKDKQEEIKRILDERGIKDPKQRQQAALQLLNGGSLGAKPAEPVPGVEPKPASKPAKPDTQGADQVTQEQIYEAMESLGRLAFLREKENRSLSEENEYSRLKRKQADMDALLTNAQKQAERLAAETQRQNQEDEKQKVAIQNAVEQAAARLSKKYVENTTSLPERVKKEFVKIPKSQEEFDETMEYLLNQRLTKYAGDVGLIGQAMGFDASKWKDQVEILTGNKLNAAKNALSTRATSKE